jgi:hypothetical protein
MITMKGLERSMLMAAEMRSDGVEAVLPPYVESQIGFFPPPANPKPYLEFLMEGLSSDEACPAAYL